MVELGRIDIDTDVSMLLSHHTYPHKGHFVADFHIMSYLKWKQNSCLALDPTYLAIVYEKFETEKYWTAFYGDVKEAIPPNAPTSLGNSVDLRMMVYSDHVGYKTTRCSRTVFMIFVNLALIAWLSKKQPNLESAVFVSESVARKHGVETL